MSKTNEQPVVLKKNEENPEPMEIIAEAIIEVSRGFQKLSNSKLQQRVIILLIKDMTGQSISDIEKVLNAATRLENKYIKQK
jgi:hypothetical protein